jgi:Haem-binding domain
MKTIKKIILWGVAGLAALFILIQFIQPAHTNPPVKSDFLTATKAPENIAAMYHAACYDCHSDETRWPWYSHVAPMSWQIAQDVNEGRDALNLSEWPSIPKSAWKRMENMSDLIESGEMPIKKYTLLHKDARLTEDQRKALTDWLGEQVAALKSQGGTN